MVGRHQNVHLRPQEIFDKGVGGFAGCNVNFGFHLPLAHRLDHHGGTDAHYQEDQSGTQAELRFEGNLFDGIQSSRSDDRPAY